MRVFQLSTQTGNSIINAQRGLTQPLALTAVAVLLAQRGLTMPPSAQGWVWGFKDGTPLARGGGPLPGDLAARVEKDADEAYVARLYRVLDYFPNHPGLPQSLGVVWNGGEPWNNSVLFDELLVAPAPIPYAYLEARYGWKKGFNYAAAFMPVPDAQRFVEEFQSGGLDALNHGSKIHPGPAEAPGHMVINTNMPPPVRGSGTRAGRATQTSFRAKVFAAYRDPASGLTSCAACQISDESVLEAAHVVDYGRSDEEWYNGLLLCRNHHRYFDLWALRLNSEMHWTAAVGHELEAMRVTRHDLSHYSHGNPPPRPHPDAVAWRWTLA